MKKLEKLTLKELSSELTVISPNELPKVIGGNEPTPQTVVNYCEGQVESAFAPITNAVSETIDAVGNAANAVGNAVENVITSPITGVVVSIAVDLYMLYNGLGTPSQGPTVLPGGDGSSYGFNPYVSYDPSGFTGCGPDSTSIYGSGSLSGSR